MPRPSEYQVQAERPLPPAGTELAQLQVDRIACTGQGICAQLLPENFRLDDHGYPIVVNASVPGAAGETAIRLCPARALYWKKRLS